MDTIDWVTAETVSVSAVTNREVEGQPWPVVVANGNLHFFSGGTDDADLRCIPLNADDTLSPADTGAVDFDCIEVELADCCRSIAALIRSQIALETMEAERDGIAPTVQIPQFDSEIERDVATNA